MEATSRKLQHHFFLILLIGVVLLMFMVVQPFITPLVLAFALAIIFRTPYERLLAKLKGKESLAALVVIALVIIIVLIPLTIIGSLLFNEVRILYINLATSSGTATIIDKVNYS